MTVYRKISLLMLAVFLLVYLLGALLYTQQARHDVQRELDGVTVLAQSLDSPERLPGSVVSGLRHLRPSDNEESGKGGDVPAWFFELIAGDASRPLINGCNLSK